MLWDFGVKASKEKRAFNLANRILFFDILVVLALIYFSTRCL